MTSTQTIASGLGFVEGPTLLQSGSTLVVSLDHQRLYEIAPDGAPTAVAAFEAAPNGATEGAGGTVYVAAFSGAWPARPECTGQGGVYAYRGSGIALVSTEPAAPNDLCFGRDGLLYVTDPVRGRTSGRIWRIDVRTGDAEVIADLDWYPNGLAFDADDNLWVADTYGRRLVCHPPPRGSLGDPVATIALPQGKPDGFAFDRAGNLVVPASPTPDHAASSVLLFGANGDLIDVLITERGAYHTNVAITADGAAVVTDAEQGRVLVLAGACEPALALHPFRTTRGS